MGGITPSSQSLFATQTQPVRALATTYQNVSTKPRLVCASIRNANGVTGTAYCDVNADPTGVAVAYGGSQTAGTSVDSCLMFVVPPMYYYQVQSAGGALIEWTEWS